MVRKPARIIKNIIDKLVVVTEALMVMCWIFIVTNITKTATKIIYKISRKDRGIIFISFFLALVLILF